jgi:hypothetical protein
MCALDVSLVTNPATSVILIIAIIIPFHFSELERGLPPPTFSCKEHLIFFTAIVMNDFLSLVLKVSVMEK